MTIILQSRSSWGRCSPASMPCCAVQATPANILSSGSIRVDLLQGRAFKNNTKLELTAAEYKLLCLFLQNADHLLSKEQILDRLWDCSDNYIDASTLTVYIRRLRMKIEDDPGSPQYILTVRGLGYKWNGAAV